jgi:hypothetical protein
VGAQQRRPASQVNIITNYRTQHTMRTIELVCL